MDKKENKPAPDGYPKYPENEDIYNQEKKKAFNEGEKDDSTLDEDLDIPGAELDDVDEVVGEEDEENNYYSLGGDEHNDLDEEDPDVVSGE